MEGLIQCSANYVPLSPISFLERASMVFGDRVSVIYGSMRYTWRQTYERCLKLASALTQLNISGNDIVAALGPNIPAMYELHFAVPMAGAILSPLNPRQDTSMLSAVLTHLEAKVLFVDYQFLELALGAFEILSKTSIKLPLLVLIPETDPETHTPIEDPPSSCLYYDDLLAQGKPDFKIIHPKDECDPISVIFTSGSTGTPKGVVHSHRGAYLNTLAEIILNGMKTMPVYLWTVPMYHCNGWCFIWAVAALGGTNICLRKYDAKFIFDNIVTYNVTNLGGATPVLSLIINAPACDRKLLPFKVDIMTGGAPPPPQVVLNIEQMGFNLTHSYGMSETLGPGTVFIWKPEWDSLPPYEQAKKKSLHGLNNIIMEAVDIKDPVTMESVPFDGKTMGEVMFRGNPVMKGYFKNLTLTQEAFKGGWFRTGDLGVRHPNGYIDVKERNRDSITSGGETISSVDTEEVLFRHPAIFEAAVVGIPDEVVGERTCAFVRLKEGCNATSEEIIGYCGERLPENMVPKAVIFGELPITSTGKTQKYVLREKAKALK